MQRSVREMQLRGSRIVVTGAAGRVGFPIARHLATPELANTVYGVARLSSPGDAARLRAAGVEPVRRDFGDGSDFRDLPDADYVFHAAAALGPAAAGDWRYAFEVNAQAAGRLVERYAACRGFVYCSTGSAYRYQGARPLREDDPPGTHIGNYSFSKIAGEAVVTFASRRFGTPVTIIRIFSTYGPMGGAPADRLELILEGRPVPLHPDTPNRFNPIYEDDYVDLGVRALQVGAFPPVVVNWSGSETVAIEEYCTYLGALVGRPVRFVVDEAAYWPLWPDTTFMHEILGRTRVPWREGFRRMVAARHPELALTPSPIPAPTAE
ncbi:MAG: UDP-glucuronate 4-epimerase [Actinomycetota bacterium]|nr:UDP-glucuronate 4-epimerase [Actinomycetota bacterium]